MDPTCYIERTCENCGHKDRISISKKEAAFELVNINKVSGPTCKKCSQTEFSFFYKKPHWDLELLEEWAADNTLFLMPQDEGLELAYDVDVDIILHILDNVPTSKYKRLVLLEALCVIVWENSTGGGIENENDQELKQQVIDELNKRIEGLKEADDWIGDYIKKVVYPQLDMS